MKQDFLLKTQVGDKVRKVVWDASEPIALDKKNLWFLEKTPQGLRVKKALKRNTREKPTYIPVAISPVYKKGVAGTPSRIPLNDKEHLEVNVFPLKPIRSAFANPKESPTSSKARQLFLFYGTNHFLINYRPATKKYTSKVENKPVFSYKKTREGYEITSYKNDLLYRFSGEKNVFFQPYIPVTFTEDQFWKLRLTWQTHWWKLNPIPLSPPLPDYIFDYDAQQDNQYFKKLLRQGTIGFITLCVLVQSFSFFDKARHQEKPVKPPIELKEPKRVYVKKLLKPEVKKVEAPKVAKPAAPPAAPKQAKPKAAKQKVAKPQKPKPQMAPPKKVAPPKVQATPKPVPKAMPTPTPRPQQPKVDVKKAAEARERADVSKTLSFLSSNPKASARTVDNYQKSSEHYSKDATPKLSKSKLGNLPETSDGSPITTKNARNMKEGALADENFSSHGSGKKFNSVQGKVALNTLYGSGEAGSSAGEALGGSTMSISGSGQINEQAILKALSKHLDRLQYCYEKALLSDSTLAGSILMEWTITTSGAATNAKTVRSQMNNTALHNCLAKEIQKIHFPPSKGASVNIQYPFSFSSSTL
jgi:hypothetical protein